MREGFWEWVDPSVFVVPTNHRGSVWHRQEPWPSLEGSQLNSHGFRVKKETEDLGISIR